VLKGGLCVYVNQALSPVLVALRSQHALDAVLEAYHNPVAVWWGSPCTFHGNAADPDGSERVSRDAWLSRVTVGSVVEQRLSRGPVRRHGPWLYSLAPVSGAMAVCLDYRS
jgi:hypothetical protein